MTTRDNRPAGDTPPIPPWLADLVEDARRRRQQRQADRAEFAQRRRHGLRIRHAHKFRHLGGGGHRD